VRFNRALIGVHAVSSIEARIQCAGFLWTLPGATLRFAPGFDESRLRRSNNAAYNHSRILSWYRV
jgi:hypothetical protein